MPGRRFLDTNVVIYAFAADDPRSARAEALLAGGGVIGVQVLNEFTNVTRRELAWKWSEIEAALGVISEAVYAPLAALVTSRLLWRRAP